ncbi:hypothetical protein LOK49_LG07G01663 [Camellia lanceoleosa]|uniref:Uncharacterized protein n=2 Tax=Camellia lanceoleosa TaxID=1840588 RepID=A0ACC0H141_9ERIC|nr:hypothetical protein LOK49_LG07G01674 [Camellia lanceoleosa]KAI8008784.1 hypothetical protein LOK49_LG07G01663 [Camellia lanceoleosa]
MTNFLWLSYMTLTKMTTSLIRIWEFYLAGNLQDQQQQGSLRGQEQKGQSILQAFDTDILAEALNVDMETARRIQSEDDYRGFIVRVEPEFQVARP